ncbi:putative toxin-antitoxin system toxin component, PIN family [Spirosoma sp. BT704]|uniref:Toxin-antitoxin system toxin component, PIN family n=2 Tax=Spirosoma validum TaxID=2771355 RepID=A0A927GBJ4_9BACT|nr:putative toxin-antitoxin system toxin component, PIN family [Spirosoma validum]
MRVVLDTNVLIVSLASYSKYFPIYQALLDKRFQLYVSNEIVAEYEEQIGKRLGLERTDVKFRELLNLDNIHFVDPTYNWQLIEADPDDNKFVDCAIAANADCVVTNDSHFNVLKDVTFPHVSVINISDFVLILSKV